MATRSSSAGGGPDQQVNRKENRVPCEAPNAVCVYVGDDNATCANAAEPCEAGAAATCDGNVLLSCEPFESALGISGPGTDQSFVQGTDCAASGMVCGPDGADGPVACVAAE